MYLVLLLTHKANLEKVNQINKKWLDILSNEMDKAFLEHRNIQLYNNQY